MTPLVIGIDPGTKQSAYVAWDGNFITDVATVPNTKVLTYLRSLDPKTCVVLENVEPYGMAVGRETFETIYWIGRFFQRARDIVGLQQVSRLPRRAVKKHLRLKPGAGDKEVRKALINILERNPIEWHGMKGHEVQALALAVTWWNTERTRQPLKQERKSAA
jgi:hypothetical protein